MNNQLIEEWSPDFTELGEFLQAQSPVQLLLSFAIEYVVQLNLGLLLLALWTFAWMTRRYQAKKTKFYFHPRS